MTTRNQEGALALWRSDGSRDDPPYYSVGEVNGERVIWLPLGGNTGWYRPEILNGELTGIRAVSLPKPSKEETSEDREKLNYATKWLSPKQRAKIVHAMEVSVA